MKCSRFPQKIVLLFPFLLIALNAQTKPQISKEKLSATHIEVYSAFLKVHLANDERIMNLANRTYPIDVHEVEASVKYLKIQLVHIDKASRRLHLIGPEILRSGSLLLVDPDKMDEAIKRESAKNWELLLKVISWDKNEPGKVESGISPMEESVANGYLSFTEIAFDKKHETAVFSYTFHSNALKYGGTAILRKVGAQWEQENRSNYWIQ